MGDANDLPGPPRLSLAVLLALAFAGLVVYASLYPFEGWQWPKNNPARLTAVLPWSQFNSPFDIVANLLGYVPLGLLVFIGAQRSGWRQRSAWLLATLGSAALSYALELTQQLLPTRVPALLDWLLNASGGLLGASLGVVLVRAGLHTHWQAWRERWFVDRSAGAVLLLMLWPVGLLFPAPVPLGLGQVLERLRQLAVAALAGTPWASLMASANLAAPMSPPPLGAFSEMSAVAFGLLSPCLLAFSITRSGWRRVVLTFGAALVGTAMTTLSTALHFGPDHALGWLTPSALPGLALGIAMALALMWLPRRGAAALGLVVVTALIALVAQAPADPYYAATLQAWEQGRFIRFHGVAQWVGWLWPYALLLALLVRVSRREPL